MALPLEFAVKVPSRGSLQRCFGYEPGQLLPHSSSIEPRFVLVCLPSCPWLPLQGSIMVLAWHSPEAMKFKARGIAKTEREPV